MAISHADHDHPNTPAARAACRKRINAGQSPRDESAERALNTTPFTVVPSSRSKATADRLAARASKAGLASVAPRRLKVTGTLIKSVADMADVPAKLAPYIRAAWAANFTVQVGHPFNDDERRIVITRAADEVALVWSSSTGRTGIFTRNLDSSITRRVKDVAAFTL